MTFPKTAAFAIVFVFTALSVYSQRQTPSAPAQSGAETAADEGQTGVPDLSRLSVFDLIDAAAGTSLDWRPGWPLPPPPDLFRILPGSDVTSIALTFEQSSRPSVGNAGGASSPQTALAAEAVSLFQPRSAAASADKGSSAETAVLPPQFPPITIRRRNGVFTEFPVFLEGSADTPAPFFFQGRAEYAGNGALRRITVGGGPDLEAAVLESDEENRPVLVRLLIAGEYFFSALEYSFGRVTETRYDQDGAPVAVMYQDDSGEDVRITYNRAAPAAENAVPAGGNTPSAGESGAANGPTAGVETRRVFRNAFGAVSGLQSPAETYSALYERRGLPRYLERIPNAAVSDGGSAVPAAVSANSASEHYRFQWNENGRLLRLTGVDAEGLAVSVSFYEYTLDNRGNWTECREIVMQDLAGRLFPMPGLTVRRRITYGRSQP